MSAVSYFFGFLVGRCRKERKHRAQSLESEDSRKSLLSRAAQDPGMARAKYLLRKISKREETDTDDYHNHKNISTRFLKSFDEFLKRIELKEKSRILNKLLIYLKHIYLEEELAKSFLKLKNEDKTKEVLISFLAALHASKVLIYQTKFNLNVHVALIEAKILNEFVQIIETKQAKAEDFFNKLETECKILIERNKNWTAEIQKEFDRDWGPYVWRLSHQSYHAIKQHFLPFNMYTLFSAIIRIMLYPMSKLPFDLPRILKLTWIPDSIGLGLSLYYCYYTGLFSIARVLGSGLLAANLFQYLRSTSVDDNNAIVHVPKLHAFTAVRVYPVITLLMGAIEAYYFANKLLFATTAGGVAFAETVAMLAKRGLKRFRQTGLEPTKTQISEMISLIQICNSIGHFFTGITLGVWGNISQKLRDREQFYNTIKYFAAKYKTIFKIEFQDFILNPRLWFNSENRARVLWLDYSDGPFLQQVDCQLEAQAILTGLATDCKQLLIESTQRVDAALSVSKLCIGPGVFFSSRFVANKLRSTCNTLEETTKMDATERETTKSERYTESFISEERVKDFEMTSQRRNANREEARSVDDLNEDNGSGTGLGRWIRVSGIGKNTVKARFF